MAAEQLHNDYVTELQEANVNQRARISELEFQLSLRGRQLETAINELARRDAAIAKLRAALGDV
jgi:hypothetical protein